MGLRRYQAKILSNYVVIDVWDYSKLIELRTLKPLCSFEIFENNKKVNEYNIHEVSYTTSFVHDLIKWDKITSTLSSSSSKQLDWPLNLPWLTNKSQDIHVEWGAFLSPLCNDRLQWSTCDRVTNRWKRLSQLL